MARNANPYACRTEILSSEPREQAVYDFAGLVLSMGGEAKNVFNQFTISEGDVPGFDQELYRNDDTIKNAPVKDDFCGYVRMRYICDPNICRTCSCSPKFANANRFAEKDCIAFILHASTKTAKDFFPREKEKALLIESRFTSYQNLDEGRVGTSCKPLYLPLYKLMYRALYALLQTHKYGFGQTIGSASVEEFKAAWNRVNPTYPFSSAFCSDYPNFERCVLAELQYMLDKPTRSDLTTEHIAAFIAEEYSEEGSDPAAEESVTENNIVEASSNEDTVIEPNIEEAVVEEQTVETPVVEETVVEEIEQQKETEEDKADAAQPQEIIKTTKPERKGLFSIFKSRERVSAETSVPETTREIVEEQETSKGALKDEYDLNEPPDEALLISDSEASDNLAKASTNAVLTIGLEDLITEEDYGLATDDIPEEKELVEEGLAVSDETSPVPDVAKEELLPDDIPIVSFDDLEFDDADQSDDTATDFEAGLTEDADAIAAAEQDEPVEQEAEETKPEEAITETDEEQPEDQSATPAEPPEPGIEDFPEPDFSLFDLPNITREDALKYLVPTDEKQFERLKSAFIFANTKSTPSLIEAVRVSGKAELGFLVWLGTANQPVYIPSGNKEGIKALSGHLKDDHCIKVTYNAIPLYWLCHSCNLTARHVAGISDHRSVQPYEKDALKRMQSYRSILATKIKYTVDSDEVLLEQAYARFLYRESALGEKPLYSYILGWGFVHDGYIPDGKHAYFSVTAKSVRREDWAKAVELLMIAFEKHSSFNKTSAKLCFSDLSKRLIVFEIEKTDVAAFKNMIARHFVKILELVCVEIPIVTFSTDSKVLMSKKADAATKI